MIPISPGGQADPRKDAIKNVQETTKKYMKYMEMSKNGEKSWFDMISEAWAGQAKMTKEGAKGMGLMRGKEQNPSFWAPKEGHERLWEGGPLVAGGFRDFLSRTAIVSGAADVLAPLVLAGKDLERFKEELRASNPTEAMEQVTMSVRLARERGEDEGSIKKN